MFSRRRSSVSPAPTSGSSDIEKPRRHRLSKPMTNKSSTNLRLHALQQENTSRNSSTTHTPLSPLPSQTGFEQSRDLIKAHIFGSETDLTKTTSLPGDPGSWKGTAFMVKNIEAAHSVDHLPLAPSTPGKKSSRPFSGIFGLRPLSNNSSKSVLQNASRENVASLKGSPVLPASPGVPTEDFNPPPLRNQRRSSFNPGEATRQEKVIPVENSPSQALTDIEEQPVQTQPTRFSFEEEWELPPRIARTETPADLECTHIGGLKLGSLQIMNGRASPAPSELSRHFRPQIVTLGRRDTSSEYGDSEVTEVPSISTLMQSSRHSHVSEIDTSPRKTEEVPSSPTHAPTSSHSPVSPRTPDRFAVPKRKPVPSPDRTSMMAMEYMAEISHSPFSTHRSSSPAGSVIVTRSKASEFDDKLFDDETMAPSIYSDADRATIETWYTGSEVGSVREEVFSSTVEFQRQMSPQKLRPPEDNSRAIEDLKTAEKSDSGYSSNVSLRDDASEEIKVTVAEEIVIETLIIIPDILQEKPVQLRARPTSILKQSRATAPELPTFRNLQQIASAPSSSHSNASFQQPPKPSRPKKLQKRRQVSKVLPVEKIRVQGGHLDQGEIPPVPAEVLANLSIRNQQLPELEKTFRTMHHTKDQPSMSTMSLPMTDIRFPSPEPEAHEPALRARPLSFRRRSVIGRTPSEKRVSQQQTPTGISEAAAMAIIHGGFGTVVSSLGRDPYDFPGRRPVRQSANNAGMTMFQARAPQPRPRSMMDDQTAAELARLRSRAAFERENMYEQRFFNDRGGIPGKNFRPQSIASDIPPMPQMPHKHRSWQPEQQFSSPHQPLPRPIPTELTWRDRRDTAEKGSPPLPPKHSPRPAFIEPAEEVEDFSLAPPPPSHSPRPMIIESEGRPADVWAAQAEVWKSRRLAAGMLRSSFEAQDSPTLDPTSEEPEPLYPEIPLRHRSIQPHEEHWRPPREYFTPLTQSVSYPEGFSSQRPLPQPSGNSYWADEIDRPRSRGSQISNAGSLAESLHPPDLERPQPPHEFGRYSGGLGYDYERGAGFGGSAGTRSISGKANMARKGLPIRSEYGIDLGDVPIIAGLQRVL